MEQGKIIKIISNRYEVLDTQGQRLICVAMGKVRKQKVPVVGDIVLFERFEDQIGIQEICERKNELRRPAIANVDQAVIVMSCVEPAFSTILIDRLLFLIAYANIKPILCITKTDLIAHDHPLYQDIEDYRKSGYEVYETSLHDIESIASIWKDKISVLTGQSGAGKSTLLNSFDESLQLQTQATSKALGRGKHTTRHCELYEIGGGWIADTPGFSSLDFSHLDAQRLANSILDFQNHGACKFRDCLHIHEPGCAIRQGVEEGRISSTRYRHYQEVLELIKQGKVKY